MNYDAAADGGDVGTQRLGEGRTGQVAESETTVLLRHAQGQHAERPHLLQDLAGDLAGFFPRLAVGRDLVGDELDRLVVDRLQFICHVDVAVHLVSL